MITGTGVMAKVVDLRPSRRSVFSLLRGHAHGKEFTSGPQVRADSVSLGSPSPGGDANRLINGEAQPLLGYGGNVLTGVEMRELASVSIAPYSGFRGCMAPPRLSKAEKGS